MLRIRTIPCLLLRGRALVKTVRFRRAAYIGDPINTVRIFSQMEVDEIILLDIAATGEGREPQFELIEEIAGEAFMPLTYGGGVRSLEQMERLFAAGVEKVALNTAAHESPGLIEAAAARFGSQSVVAAIDVGRRWWGGYAVYTRSGRRRLPLDPVACARACEARGAGELLLTAIDRDGTMSGYDLELIRQVCAAVRVPVIACGGAGELGHLAAAVRDGGCPAVALGSLVVYQGRNRSVLINYPARSALKALYAGLGSEASHEHP